MYKKLLSTIKGMWLGTGIKKIVFTSTAVLTAIIVCAFAVASGCAVATHKHSVFKSCENYTKFVKIGLEAELKALINNLNVYMNEPIISPNENLYKDGFLDSPLIDDILKKLRGTVATNSLIKDIAVTFYNHPIVITQSGFFSSDYMKNSPESMLVVNDFDYNKEKKVVHMHAQQQPKIYGQPHSLYLYFLTDDYRMTISVDVNNFISKFNKTKFYDDSSIILVMNSAGKIILTNDYQTSLSLDKKKIFDAKSMSYNGDYLLVKEKGENALTYAVLYDKATIKNDISSVNHFYIIAYLITLVAILAFLYLLYNILVIPLKKFANNFLSVSGSSKKNEFVALLDYVEIMNEQIFEMSDYILSTKDTTNNAMMINAILYNSASRANHEFTTYENNFFRDAFPLDNFMLAYFITGTSDDTLSTGLSVALDAMNTKYEFCFIADDGFFVVINYNGSAENVRKGLKKYVDDRNKSNLRVVAIVSDPAKSIEDISECTKQVSSIKKHRDVRKKSKLYTEADIVSDRHMLAAFVENETAFMNLIKIGDKENLAESLKNIFKNSEKSSYSDCYTFFMYLHNFVIRAAFKPSGEAEQQELPYSSFITKNNPAILDYDKLRDSFSETCMMLCERANDLENNYEDEIIKYIKINYNKFISLDIVAQKFNMNPSYLSTYIKKKIGMSFVEYMRMLRISNAKKLLTETDLDIAEITETLGFTDTSSFIRYFKKSEGITPKQYRTTNKKLGS